MKRFGIASIGLVSLALFGCPQKDDNTADETMTLGEAQEAVTEAGASTQASELASTEIELNTNFTIGGAVQNAALELRTFLGSQLPCADVALQNATLTITYGAKPGNCTYHGHTFSGQSTVTVSRNEAAEVVVDHAWKDLSNGLIKLNGTAKVTWSLANKSRHVVHTLSWTRLSDDRTGTGSGDRTQTVLEGGLAEGIRVDGTRAWDGPHGHWDLSIQGVELRWVDPVPQAGKYLLVNPKGKSLSMSFARIDADTIEVTVSRGARTFKFKVHRAAGDVDAI